MICPNCHKEITFVHRFLVYRVGDAYPITDDGDVNIATDCLCLPEDSPEPTASIFEQVGGEDVTYRCPECGDDIEGVWDEDGNAEKVYTCSHCLRELRESDGDSILFCNGYDEEDPGDHVVSCDDCAGLLLDGMQNCEECNRENGDEEEE